MTDENKRIITVNGVKLEVDLRQAKRIDAFKVGDAVKVLIKKYGDSYESHFGMLVGFDEFKTLPTLIVAYIDGGSWSTEPLKIVYINEKSKDVEICAHDDHDLGINQGEINDQFYRQITKKEEEIRDLQLRQTYFNKMFGRYFMPEAPGSVG